jgi:hypothetical protein
VRLPCLQRDWISLLLSAVEAVGFKVMEQIGGFREGRGKKVALEGRSVVLGD